MRRARFERLAILLAGLLGWAVFAAAVPVRGLSQLRVAALWLGLAGALLAVVVRAWSLRQMRWGIAATLFLLALAAYNTNGRLLTAGDNVPARELAGRILAGHGLDYDELSAEDRLPYYLTRTAKGVHTAFPLGTGLLAVPFGAVADVVQPRLLDSAPVFEKALASWLTALAVAVFYLGLARRFGSRRALVPSLVLAFATPLATCQSQGLWSATGSVVASVSLLHVALGRGGRGGALGALAGSAAIVLCRPSDVAVALVALARKRSVASFLVASAALVLGAVAAISFDRFFLGSLAGYANLNLAEVGFSWSNIPSGLAGLLVSPSRGLFVFLPWLLISVPWFAVDRRLPGSLRATTLAGVALTLLLASAYGKWWGGFSFGPRLLAGTAPLLALTTLVVTRARSPRRRLGKGIFVFLVVLSAAIQSLGANRRAPAEWNPIVDPDRSPELLWDIRNSQLAATLERDWRFEPRPYAPSSPEPKRSRSWVRFDLGPFANARFDDRLFPWQARVRWSAAFPRLRPELMNHDDAMFDFLALGKPNAVALCQSGATLELRLDPPRRVRSVQLVATADGRLPLPARSSVARLILFPAEPSPPIEHELALNRHVYSYDPDGRTELPSPRFVYAGERHVRDALFRTRIPVTYGGRLRGLSLVREPSAGSDLCVAVLAVTAEVLGRRSPNSDKPEPRANR